MKILRYIAMGFIALILLIAISMFVLLRTDMGTDFVKNQGLKFAKQAGFDIAIDGLNATLPSSLSAKQITVSDDEGVWLSVRNLDFAWKPWALLDKAIVIERLNADSIDLVRLPASEAKPQTNEPFRLPTLPFIKVKELNLPLVRLPDSWSGGNALRASAKASGTNEHFNAWARLWQDEAEIAKLTIEQSDHLSLKGTGEIPDALAKQWQLPVQQWALDANVGVDDGLWKLYNTTLDMGNIRARVNAAYNLDNAAFSDTELTLDIDDFAPWNALLASDIAGGAKVALGLDGSLDDATLTIDASSKMLNVNQKTLSNLSASLRGKSNLETWKDEAWAKSDITLAISGDVEGEPIAVRANAKLKKDKQITVESLNAKTAFATVAASLDYNLNSTQLAGQFSLSQSDIAKITDGKMQGFVTGKGTAQGTLKNVNITTDLAASNLQGLPPALDGWITSQANITAAANYTPQKISLSNGKLTSGSTVLKGAGSIPLTASDAPSKLEVILQNGRNPEVKAHTLITQSDEAITLSGLEVTSLNSAINGDMTYLMNSGLAKGTLAIDSPDISTFASWVNMPQSSGSVKANIELMANGSKQRVALDGTARAVSLPSLSIALKQLDAKLTLDDAATLEGIDLTLNARDFVQNTLNLHTIEATANTPKGGTENTRFSLTTQGTQGSRPLTLKASGNANFNKDRQRITLNQLDGALSNITATLQKPSELIITQNSVTLSPLQIAMGEALLNVRLDKTASQVNADATLSNLNTKTVATFLGSSLPEAVVNADLNVKGAPNKPVATLTTRSVISTDFSEAPPITVYSRSIWDNTARNAQIATDATIAMNQEIGTAQMRLPASLSLAPFAFTMAENAPVEGALAIETTLAPFSTISELYGHKLSGALRSDIALKGTLKKLQPSGYVTLNNAKYDHQKFGVCFRDLNARATFTDKALTVSSFSAKGNENQGTIDVKGGVDLAGSAVDTKITLKDVALLCDGIATGNISGDVHINGKFSALQVKGGLEIEPLDIALPGSGAASIPLIKTTSKREKLRDSQSKSTVTLAMNVSFPRKVFVRGRGLDAEFEGDLTLEGTAASPEIDGTLNVKRGRMDLLGSRLDITEGTITFLNRDPISPYVNISASTEAGDVEIIVGLEGLVKEPQITLSSSPTLPEDEILGLLLFGRPLQKITPFQALQLAKAARTLAGKDSGPDMLGMLRDTIGLDALTINQDENGDTTVGAEKYITDRVYIGVEQGATPESRKVKTEIEITPNITAETSTGVQSGPSVGVEWRYDY